ncbi:MAG TPA: patatin-like phospholipase family protein [Williamwhitmania sp.]|nr:patatin-like phospholipase family protein [Williamwhitmania sp.]
MKIVSKVNSFFLVLVIIMLRIDLLFGQSVGLVLSGGGAKGLAHIGVIKALEENGIPIDYITGTSMGAIIGGLYAIGYSPHEMDSLFRTEDFKNWSRGVIDENFTYYFKRGLQNSGQFSIKISFKDSVPRPKLPTNIIPTHQMDLAFLKIFAGASASCDYNFNNLFVPFRCVASDVYHNKQFICSSGDLGSSIRASMTFPFYYKPITIDSVLLFDGGIYNNFPWDIMEKDFHPDIIIGSQVSHNSPRPDEDNILAQVENMIMGKTNYKLPKDKGLVIETSFNDVGLLDFDKIDEIEKAGYDQTIKFIDSIKTRVHRRNNLKELAAKRAAFQDKFPKLTFNKVVLTGLKGSQENYFYRSFHRNNHKTFNMNDLEREYFKLLSDKSVVSIYPLAHYDSTAKAFDLNLKIQTDNFLDLSFGGNISSSSMNQGFLGAEYRFFRHSATSLYMNVGFGRLYSSLLLGVKRDFPWKIPVYYDLNLCLNRFDYYNSSIDPFFEDVKPSYLIQTESYGSFSVGFALGTQFLLKLNSNGGIERSQYYQTTNFLKSDIPDVTDFTYINVGTSFGMNSLNYKQYADRGIFRQISFSYINGYENYSPGTTSPPSNTNAIINHDWYELRFLNESYHKIYRGFRMGVIIDGVYSSKRFFENYTSTLISSTGFTPNPHSKTLFLPNYHANSYIAAGVIPILKLSNNLQLRLEGYFFQPYKSFLRNDVTYSTYYSPKWPKFILMGAAGMVYQTTFGPASIFLNYYDKENKNLYITFNFGFILFNNRGIQ